MGPHLNDVVGRQAGTGEGFNYSRAMVEAGENGLIWTPETLSPFLESPREHVPGTKMAFGGVKDEAERANIIAYLLTFSPDYVADDAAVDGSAAGSAPPAAAPPSQ
jgi:cytochrome c